ncbi:MAG: polysaccharide deacetylase family protein [Patescibacteria group bacterium]|jgi:peptidoglycan/xylan/chitin deacetylase (PgdA/CDA1 family)|nr:polysaccharide deacetylase family protein [Patescibacteria group bacterium]
MPIKSMAITMLLAVFLTGCHNSLVATETSNDLKPTTTQPITGPKPDQPITVPVLIYHNIREITPQDSASSQEFIVTPQNFADQLQYLNEHGFQTILIRNLPEYFAGQFTLPPKPVIITFDDGKINQYNKALPLLVKYHFQATFFVFANPIGKSPNYLNWDQLQELQTQGMEIGSHGYYHSYLTKIDNQALELEIGGSKKKLEDNLQVPIVSFAYPFGLYDDRIAEAVKTAGYTTARDIINGLSHSADDLFKLKGYFITNDFARFKNIVTPADNN